MQLDDIFESLIRDDSLSLEIKFPPDTTVETVEEFKADLSKYKYRNKELYEELFGKFRLKFETRSTDPFIIYVCIVSENKHVKSYAGIEINSVDSGIDKEEERGE